MTHLKEDKETVAMKKKRGNQFLDIEMCQKKEKRKINRWAEEQNRHS